MGLAVCVDRDRLTLSTLVLMMKMSGMTVGFVLKLMTNSFLFSTFLNNKCENLTYLRERSHLGVFNKGTEVRASTVIGVQGEQNCTRGQRSRS